MSKINQLKKCSAICLSEMWKTKKSLWPKKSQSIPTGKKDHKGKLLTGPKDIKKLLEKEYRERLRKKPSHPNLIDLDSLKKEEFEAKLKESKHNESEAWTMGELEYIL